MAVLFLEGVYMLFPLFSSSLQLVGRNISMKNMSFCRELTHVCVRAEAKCLFNESKRVSPARYLAGAPVPAGESHLPGYRRRVQPPANLFLPKATATILIEAPFRSGMGAPKSKKSGEVF